MRRVLTIALFLLLGWSMSVDSACIDCHRGHLQSMDDAPHSSISPKPGEDNNCTVCHDDGENHPTDLSSDSLMTFTVETAPQKNAVCVECHGEQHSTNPGAHAQAGLACTDCHTVHPDSESAPAQQSLNGLDPGSAACSGCHEDVLAQFSFNKRHRLRENSVTCVSCHDPHEPTQRLQLGAFKHAQCLTCHTDKEGPFVFEHAASRVEGCVACHVPHGSANRHLLTHQDVGAQCYGCHAEVAQFHLGFAPVGSPRFGVDTVCTNCHSTIHGSNFDRFFLK